MLIFDTQEILRRFFAVNGDILLKRVRCWHKCEASLKNIGFVEGCGVIFIKITKLRLQRGKHFTLFRQVEGDFPQCVRDAGAFSAKLFLLQRHFAVDVLHIWLFHLLFSFSVFIIPKILDIFQ